MTQDQNNVTEQEFDHLVDQVLDLLSGDEICNVIDRIHPTSAEDFDEDTPRAMAYYDVLLELQTKILTRALTLAKCPYAPKEEGTY